MDLILSGLAEKACYECLGVKEGLHPHLNWVTASDFFASAQGFSPAANAQQWVWLYRAPWKWLVNVDTPEIGAELEQWLGQQRQIIRLRRHLGQQLTLVNSDRVAAGVLCYKLNLPERPSAVAQPELTALEDVMAILFQHIAPQYWDVFEVLEASAWLPEGEAQFRHTTLTPTEEDLHDLLRLVRNGLAWPACQAAAELRATDISHLEQRLVDAGQQVQQLTEEGANLGQVLNRSKQVAIQAEAERWALKEENHLLLEQLHQAQEALEDCHLRNEAQLAVLAGNHAATIKQHEQQLANVRSQLEHVSVERTQVDQALNQGKLDYTQAENKRKVLSEENDLLLKQLHHAQEELESYYLANQELQMVMGQSQKTLGRARNLVSRLICNG